MVSNSKTQQHLPAVASSDAIAGLSMSGFMHISLFYRAITDNGRVMPWLIKLTEPNHKLQGIKNISLNG